MITRRNMIGIGLAGIAIGAGFSLVAPGDAVAADKFRLKMQGDKQGIFKGGNTHGVWGQNQNGQIGNGSGGSGAGKARPYSGDGGRRWTYKPGND